MTTLFLLQHSPQDRRGFEVFFAGSLEELSRGRSVIAFLRGDGVYQSLQEQRLEEPGLSVPVDGGWTALKARGVEVYVSRRCAALRGLNEPEFHLDWVHFADLDRFCELCLEAGKVVVL